VNNQNLCRKPLALSAVASSDVLGHKIVISQILSANQSDLLFGACFNVIERREPR
jgi:hypothetical protein